MGKDSVNWTSFWDLASPQEAARLLCKLHGPNATRISAECALAATGDGRNEDYNFWLAVFRDLRAMGENLPVTDLVATPN